MGVLTLSQAARERTIGVAATILMVLALLVVFARLADDPIQLTIDGPDDVTIDEVDEPTDEPSLPASTPLAAEATEQGELAFFDPSEEDRRAPPPRVTTISTTTNSSWFGSRYPAHDAATENPNDPATLRWALVIGVNDHLGGVRDNIGSRQDAEDLVSHLRDLGWRSDHVLLLTDATATRRHIQEGLSWLARKTSDDSVVAIHYSGHVKQWYGSDVDGDGESTDEALWPSDNLFITDKEFSERVARIDAERIWVDIGGCEAAGFADAPIVRPNMVMTFSSEEDEKSYEDPSKSNSVWGWYLVERGFLQGLADTDGNGEITVEEAFAYARPKAASRTAGQRRGPQNPVIIDTLPGDFSLEVPDPPPPPPPPPPADDEPPADEPDDDGGIVPPPPGDDDGGGCILLVCRN